MAVKKESLFFVLFLGC